MEKQSITRSRRTGGQAPQAASVATRVFIAEDHFLVRQGLIALLSNHGIEVVGQAESAEQTIETCLSNSPDVIVLDLNFADDGRIELIDRILAKNPNARLLVYSMRKAIEIIDAAYKRGARGYITKDKAPELVIEAINEIRADRYYYMPGMADQVAEYNATRRPLRNPREALTKSELDVFLKLANGTSAQDIAEELQIKKRSVDNYVLTICKKLGCREIDFAVIAIRYGLLAPAF